MAEKLKVKLPREVWEKRPGAFKRKEVFKGDSFPLCFI
jgi:hypothetical protein